MTRTSARRTQPTRHNDVTWMPGFFGGDDVYIVGSGASLTGLFKSGELRDRLAGKRVIVMNQAYLYVDHDVFIYLDKTMTGCLQARGTQLRDMPCKVVVGPSSIADLAPGGLGDNCTVIQTVGKVSSTPGQLYHARGSGLVAINLAIMGNAKRIFLLGFDGCLDNGRAHFYSGTLKCSCDAPPDRNCSHDPTSNVRYERQFDHFNEFVGLAEIYNANPDSALRTFPKITIDQALSGLVMEHTT